MYLTSTVGVWDCGSTNNLYTNLILTFQGLWECGTAVASHAGLFRGARISSLPTNACSTENNIPFPRLANHVVLSKFWKVDLDRRVTR